METPGNLTIFLIQDFAIILVAAAVAAWICGKVGLSRIVGYLVAGIVVGTPEITFLYVTDPVRIQLLSQIGLVFLMFSIGLGFRLQRFKQLGIGVVVATASTALLTLTLTRLIGGWLGYSEAECLFLAGMLMVSSSAVIGKTLQEGGLLHRRFGQVALGVTLCEDLVAIVMLAFLGSYAVMDPAAAQEGWASMAGKVGMLVAFASLLLLPGLVFVPRMMRKLSEGGAANRELESLVALGLLFSMAFLTLYAGYSLALGAFLCGMIVAESPKVRLLTESFSGMRDMFVAVFFVAIGMSIDVTQLHTAVGLIIFGSLLAIFARWAAATISLLLATERPDDAVKAGLCLTPIGEFSFVIAGLGVGTGAISEDFQIAAVGMSFVTTVLSPWMISRRKFVTRALPLERMPLIGGVLKAYARLWEDIGRRQDRSILWRLVRPRLWQIIGGVLFATALLAFSKPVYTLLSSGESEWEDRYAVVYWGAVSLLVLAPVLALARNINAIAMIVGEGVTMGSRSSPGFRRAVVMLFRVLGLAALGFWLANFVPFSWVSGYVLAGVALVVALALFFGWRFLVRVHSEAEFVLNEVVSQESVAERSLRSLISAGSDWGVRLEDWVLGDSVTSGQSIGELGLRKRSGATIVGLERHGHYLASIGPNTHLFPGDRIFATGTEEELHRLREALSQTAPEEANAVEFSDAILESSQVEPGCRAEGKSLKQLMWPRLLGVQVVAMRRGGGGSFPPVPDQPLEAGDELLMVGTPNSLAQARAQTVSVNS